MKLTVMTQITVDGVVRGNGGASQEDRRNGCERGGWARGAGDDQTRTLITRTYQRAGAFLSGRRTYELFAGSWGAIPEMRAHPHRRGAGQDAQVRRLGHAHRTALGGHDRPVR